jgi:C4-dicarboxylate transporter DctM subunit
MSALVLLLVGVLLIALRQPLVLVLAALSALVHLLIAQERGDAFLLDAWLALNQELLLSIPLFLLAGQIVARGETAARLVALLAALTRPLPGGLAVGAVLASAVFAAVSGSGMATLMAIGTVMYPALIRHGYPPRYAAGALCAAGTLGILIPPSIPLILYGLATRSSIADLFLAGVLPGLLLTALIALDAILRHRRSPKSAGERLPLAAALPRSLPPLGMPLLVLGGIYGGFLTATEAAVIAVLYAALLESLIHRRLGLTDLRECVLETARLLGTLFPVLMFAFSLNALAAAEGLPQRLAETLAQALPGKIAFLLGVNLLLLILGCVLDIGSAILLLAPVLEPIARGYGIDPVHFGVIMVMNLEIGYLTPPLGLNLIIASALFRLPFWEVCKGAFPFVLLMLIGLFLVSFVPALSLWLPGR